MAARPTWVRRANKGSTDIATHCWRLPAADHLELLRATYQTHEYPRHFHDTYVIQVVEQGVNEFECGQSVFRAQPGDILFLHPGQVHTGRSCGTEPLRYRALYPSAELLHGIARGLGVRNAGSLNFVQPVVHDAPLAEQLRLLHGRSELEARSAEVAAEWRDTLAQLIIRHGRFGEVEPEPASRREALNRARDFMSEHLAQRITLPEMAEAARLSPFHFLRVFDQHIGMSPHQYLLNIRLLAGLKLLRRGQSIAETAQRTGFSDQSHFTRSFRRVFGATPGLMRG